MNYELFIELLKEKSIKFELNRPLSEMTTFKTGGPADVVVYPFSVDSVKLILAYLNEQSIPFYVLGRGSNVLAPDEGYRGVIISTEQLNEIKLKNDCTVEVSCGTSLIKLCKFALDNSLSGFEFAYGIPGSVGGAVYMNAGAYGGEIKDVILSCSYIDTDGNIASKNCSDLDLGYRHSTFNDSECFILSAVFKLNKSDKNEIKARMDELIGKRKDKQPLEYPSAGSTFKRPTGYFAGALIEECGLKGFSIGGAAVSEKHAGFVINKGNATSEDVLSVIKHCRDVVFSLKNVNLETEVKLLK